MNKNNLIQILTVTTLAAIALLGFSGCASLGMKSSHQVNIQSDDRIYLQIAPFDSTVQAELKRVQLDPVKVHDDLASELHYQLFLNHWEESPDSAGATVRLGVAFHHIQPGTGNSGDFVTGTLTAERKELQKSELEVREPSKDNVPSGFLSLHVPRQLADEIIVHMKPKPKKDPNDLGYPPPLIPFK